LEIHSRKSYKMRGQAFIVFKDLNSATTAKHSLNHAIIFGKEMVNNFKLFEYINYLLYENL